MQKKITLLDGAVGTSLYAKTTALGINEKAPVWTFNEKYPDLVQELCREYQQAGAEIVLANTLTANRDSLAQYPDWSVEGIITKGVDLAKDALKDTDAKVCLAIGALSQMMKPFGPLAEDTVKEIYTEQIEPGVRAGADCILLQTFFDLAMMKAAAEVAVHYDIPVYCMMTFEKKRRTLMGNTVKQIVDTLKPLGIQGIGMNCSLGPAESLEVIEEYHQVTDLPLMFKPNSGKPIVGEDGKTTQPYTPQQFVEEVAPSFEYVDYVGGCCGCDASYIRALNDELTKRGLK